MLGCTADPRPQLVVVIDTDLPVAAQVARDPGLSSDAAVDTVRVDAYRLGESVPFDRAHFAVPEVADWPVSFGVAASDGQPTTVRLRVRAFQGAFARTGGAGDDVTTDPPIGVAIDRLVEVPLPREGVEYVHVKLSGDCLGAPVNFTEETTCLDGERLLVGPREGIVITDAAPESPSQVGTWPAARERPCTGEPPPGAVCVPGGFFFLGDSRFVAASALGMRDAVPLRPVVVSAFFIDRTEVTLERLEGLVARGYAGPMPLPRGALLPSGKPGDDCTFQEDFSADRRLPVNCVTHAAATALCDAQGGALPGEAQWEFVARGRGQRRLYPWGDEPARCCAASLSRVGPEGTEVVCDGAGVEPVGSYAEGDECDGLGDVSRDGVLDLAGSVTEMTGDDLATFDSGCWEAPQGGILWDPLCRVGGALQAARGGYWNGGLDLAATPWRKAAATGPSDGFRCVYPVDASPNEGRR